MIKTIRLSQLYRIIDRIKAYLKDLHVDEFGEFGEGIYFATTSIEEHIDKVIKEELHDNKTKR